MKNIRQFLIIAIAAVAMMAPDLAAAQKGGFRASTPSYRPPTPVYRTPAPVYHAPTPVYHATAAPSSRPVTVTVPRAVPARTVTRTTPAIRPTTVRNTSTSTVQAGPHTKQAIASTPHPTQRSYRYGARNYRWTSPSMMPIWWMAAMHRPYSEDAYDAFLRRCIETRRERRSRECVRALHDRGID